MITRKETIEFRQGIIVGAQQKGYNISEVDATYKIFVILGL